MALANALIHSPPRSLRMAPGPKFPPIDRFRAPLGCPIATTSADLSDETFPPRAKIQVTDDRARQSAEFAGSHPQGPFKQSLQKHLPLAASPPAPGNPPGSADPTCPLHPSLDEIEATRKKLPGRGNIFNRSDTISMERIPWNGRDSLEDNP